MTLLLITLKNRIFTTTILLVIVSITVLLPLITIITIRGIYLPP